jgi:hypothetical protein
MDTPMLTTAYEASIVGEGVFPDPENKSHYWVVYGGELQSGAYTHSDAAFARLDLLKRGIATPVPYYSARTPH